MTTRKFGYQSPKHKPEREQLMRVARVYRNYTDAGVALEVSAGTVKRWFKKFGITPSWIKG